MTRNCTRCGQSFAVCTVDQRRCPRCTAEVNALVATDTRRRSTVRFLVARDMRGAA